MRGNLSVYYQKEIQELQVNTIQSSVEINIIEKYQMENIVKCNNKIILQQSYSRPPLSH